MSSPESFFDSLRQRIRDLTRDGKDLQQRVRAEVNGALHHAQLDQEGLHKLLRSVMDGAAEGFATAVPPERETGFRAVFDGLADGLTASADALRLTLQEAAGRGKKFTDEDLRQAAASYESLGDLFKTVTSDAVRRMGTEARDQWKDFEQHVARTWERIRPSLEAAARAARGHPWQTGREGLQAGVGLTTQAAGALLREVGQRLAALGEHLRRPGQE